MSMPSGMMLALRSFLIIAKGSSQEKAANSSRFTAPPNFSATKRANATIWSLGKDGWRERWTEGRTKGRAKRKTEGRTRSTMMLAVLLRGEGKCIY